VEVVATIDPLMWVKYQRGFFVIQGTEVIKLLPFHILSALETFFDAMSDPYCETL